MIRGEPGIGVQPKTVLLAVLLLTGCTTALVALPGPVSGQATTGTPVLTSPALDLAEAIPLVPTRSSRRASLRAPGEAIFLSGGAQGDAASAPSDSGNYIALNIEFATPADRERFAVPGATVFCRFDRFADVFVRWEESIIERIVSAPGVVCAEASGAVRVPPAPPVAALPATRAPAEKIVQGGYRGLTGKGVLVAILDSGVDFRNSDFVRLGADRLPESRIVAMWDIACDNYARRRVGLKPPVTLPNGAPLGTVFDRATLTRVLRTKSLEIPATDLVGHGTACAGIAAGNGQSLPDSDKLRGVAPEADLIVVRMCETNCEGANGAMVAAACAWADSIATALGQPLVISCSFGSQMGPHDGTRILERQIDARFPDSRVGRAWCVSAGNEGGIPLHGRLKLAGALDTARVYWRAPGGLARVEVYFEGAALEELRGVGLTSAKHTGSRIEMVEASVGCQSRQPYCVFMAQGPIGGLAFVGSSTSRWTGHVYVLGGVVDSSSADPSHTISSPGTARSAITVGSYDWNLVFEPFGGRTVSLANDCMGQEQLDLGQVSCYSSRGFSRDGTVKPDIVAPGKSFTATLARGLEGSPIGLERDAETGLFMDLDVSGKARRFAGTSAATPYVAGVIALMFEKRPGLTLGDVKTALRRHATEDRFTGKLPNPHAGNGKLDLPAVGRIIASLGK